MREKKWIGEGLERERIGTRGDRKWTGEGDERDKEGEIVCY